MKRFIFLLTAIFMCTIARSDEITINWMNTDKTIDHTTTCTIGGDVNVPIPTKYGYTFNGWSANYIPIEYLESTGTQYIDTGFVPNQDTGLKTKFVLNSVADNEAMLCGSAVSYNSRAFESFIWSRRLQFSYNNAYLSSAYAFNINDTVIVNWNKNIINYSVNGTDQKQITFSYGGFTSPYKMRMFAIIRPESINRVTSASKLKIYYFQIYDNDVLVRDFIPVLDGDGVPCMSDKVEGKFYYNQGTGQFIAGPIITD